MVKPRVPANIQAWVDARRRYHLSHAHVQMARELGMNPKKLGSVANHRQERWKRPLPEFIEELYERRFGRRKPERLMSIEERLKELEQTKTLRRQQRAARKSVRTRESEIAGSRPHALSQVAHTKVARVPAQQVNVGREAATIIACGLAHESRLIAVGPLLFFSTETGDAWVLDTDDNLARCLTRDGERLPTGIVETPESFAVEWRGTYALDGEMFVVADDTGRVKTTIGYPIEEIRRVTQLMARGGIELGDDHLG